MSTNNKLIITRIRLIFSIVCVLAIIGALVRYSLGWYSIGDTTGELDFQVLQIDSVVTMYRAIDVNYNGVPDLLSANGQQDGMYRFNSEDENGNPLTEYVAYELPYYNEKYDFEYYDSTLVLDREFTPANTLKTAELTDLCPSKIYTYKYALYNYGYSTANAVFSFDTKTSIEGKTVSDNLGENFKVRFCIVNGDKDTEEIVYGEWQNFADILSSQDRIINNEVVVSKYDASDGSGRKDVWLQIQFLPTPNSEEADSNKLQGKTVVFPDVNIRFEINE